MEIKSSNEVAEIYTEGMLNNRAVLNPVIGESEMVEKNYTMGKEIYESTVKLVADYGKIVGRDALNIMRIANSIEEQDSDIASYIKSV